MLLFLVDMSHNTLKRLSLTSCAYSSLPATGGLFVLRQEPSYINTNYVSVEHIVAMTKANVAYVLRAGVGVAELRTGIK